MNAYIVIDPDGPDACDRDLVFAASPEAARAHMETFYFADYQIERCPQGDQYIPEGLTDPTICDKPEVLHACGIEPYGWQQCNECNAWHEGDTDWCEACWDARLQEDEADGE